MSAKEKSQVKLYFCVEHFVMATQGFSNHSLTRMNSDL